LSGKNNRLVCVTGLTGSGKSTLCRLLAQKGLPVIYSDQVARQVVEKGSPCLEELAKTFGEILMPDGSLNRAALAKAAFCSPEKTAQLNRITHPYIMARIRAEIHRLFEKGEPIVVIESPC